MLRQWFCIILLCVVTVPSLAQVTVSGDSPYSTVREGNFIYVLPESYRGMLSDIHKYDLFFAQEYQKSFGWTLDEPVAVVLPSPQNQLVNGLATTIPNLSTYWYPTSGNALDDFATSSWLRILQTHETSHLYQLNAKSDFPSKIKTVFGNPYILFPFVIPIFIHPNILLPTYVVEGNAVFNESRFGLGGRLYSGSARALVLQLAAAGKITPKRLINDHIDFPFGSEKYLVGGYLQAYLGERYGTDAVNGFFLDHGQHWINPLLLNASYLRQFGIGYEELIGQFASELAVLGRKQSYVSGDLLMTSLTPGRMNADDNTIYFSTSPDLRSDPWLVKVNKSTGAVEKTRKNLSTDKIFRMPDGDYYGVESSYVSPSELKYGLFSSAERPYPESLSKIYQDRRAGSELYLNSDTYMAEAELYRDGKRVDVTSSSAVLDERAQAYYFKQSGRTRTLFRDGKPVFSYQGFYGKPVEVAKDGTIYFVAATPLGSGLFSFRDGQMYQAVDSDRIVDARLLLGKQLLVTEVTDRGYEYKITELTPRKSQPFDYHYYFEKEPQFQTFLSGEKNGQSSNNTLAANEHLWEKATSYNELERLRYNGASAYTAAWGSLAGGLLASFSDPLAYNQVSAGISGDTQSYAETYASYSNRRHLLGWYFGHSYKDTLVDVTNGTGNVIATGNKIENLGFLGVNYALWKRQRWVANLSADTSYEMYSDPLVGQRKTVGLLTSLNVGTAEVFPLSFDPYRSLSFDLSYGVMNDIDRKSSYDTVVGIGANGSYDFGSEFIGFGRVGAFTSPGQRVALVGSNAFYTNPIRIRSLVPGESSDYRDLKLAGLGFKKVVNQGVYFTQIPLAVRRFAPFVSAAYYDTKQTGTIEYLKNFTETSYGLDVEFLLAHTLPFRLTLASSFSSQTNQSAFQLRIEAL